MVGTGRARPQPSRPGLQRYSFGPLTGLVRGRRHLCGAQRMPIPCATSVKVLTADIDGGTHQATTTMRSPLESHHVPVIISQTPNPNALKFTVKTLFSTPKSAFAATAN